MWSQFSEIQIQNGGSNIALQNDYEISDLHQILLRSLNEFSFFDTQMTIIRAKTDLELKKGTTPQIHLNSIRKQVIF